MNADQERRQARSDWRAKGIVYAVSSTLAGGAAGAVLGQLGSHLSISHRLAMASASAIFGLLAGLLHFALRDIPLFQFNRETPQPWMRYGALRWAILSGATLGTGVTTRIGFWLWYSIPVSALLFGSPMVGVLIYGLYGASRGWLVWLLLAAPIRRIAGDDPATWVLSQYWRAQAVTAAYLIGVSSAAVVIVGF